MCEFSRRVKSVVWPIMAASVQHVYTIPFLLSIPRDLHVSNGLRSVCIVLSIIHNLKIIVCAERIQKRFCSCSRPFGEERTRASAGLVFRPGIL